MAGSSYSIVIPTYNRPDLLGRAIASALAQSAPPLEVLVVDDGSDVPPEVGPDPRVRLIRLPENRGNAAARNAGLAAARGRWIVFLDDDDVLLPDIAETSLAALANTSLPAPVAALSGVEVVGRSGRIISERLPPTLSRGAHFFLEPHPPGTSFLSKQTLFAETAVVRSIGGFDESFRSRVPSEMFLRLNPVCSLIGIPRVTYRQFRHEGPRVSDDPALRTTSFEQLVAKHRELFRAHPRGHAKMLSEHARTLWRSGERTAAIKAALQAMAVRLRANRKTPAPAITSRAPQAEG